MILSKYACKCVRRYYFNIFIGMHHYIKFVIYMIFTLNIAVIIYLQ